MTSARGSSELNELRYGWRSTELCDKISILSFPYRLSILCLFGLGWNCDGHHSQARDKHMALLYRKGRKNVKISQMIQQKLCIQNWVVNVFPLDVKIA